MEAARRRRLRKGKQMSEGNGVMADGAIRQALEASKMQEELNVMRQAQVQRVGNVVIAALQNFAPDVNLGLDVLLSVLGATCANTGVAIDLVHKGLDRAFEQQVEMRKQLAARTSRGPTLVGPDGEAVKTTPAEEAPAADAPAADGPLTDPRIA